MIEKSTFYLPSTNGHNNLHVIMWKPVGQVSAILQLSHGMVEHIERYDRLARFLAEKGILVVGNDHLGHGKSVSSDDELGYINALNGSETVVNDLYHITNFIKDHYKDIPYFVLGHSMGSFLIRRYIMNYGNEIDGVIIMGTGQPTNLTLKVNGILLHLMTKLMGPKHRSKMLNKASFGMYNKHFKPARTNSDWLTRDTTIVDANLADKYCTFLFTLSGYGLLYDTLCYIKEPAHIKHIPRTLPILFVSGKEDPVGDFGKGVTRVYETYKALNIKDISMKLYENDRHEIINELDYKNVYDDIYTWLNTRIDTK